MIFYANKYIKIEENSHTFFFYLKFCRSTTPTSGVWITDYLSHKVNL